MQYILLIYDQEARLGQRAEAERDKMHEDYKEFTQSIIKSGHFRAGDGLQPTSTATTVKVEGGKLVTTDGPFAETKEQLGGYYLVEARNLDEAISLAGRVPSARSGGKVEVRPVRVWPDMPKPS
jgi:hypothetical protein